MSADAAGYSRLMATDEQATIRAISNHRDTAVRIARDRSGRLFSSPGDNFLFEFSNSADALRFALDFQAAVHTSNEQLPADKRMLFRIGIHTGEMVVEGDHCYGSGINITARLERLARHGGICISGLARSTVVDDQDLVYEDIGEQRVKNIPEPVRAYFVRVPGEVVTAGRGGDASERPAIAVLPFENLSREPDQEYFCDGICEELTTSLAMLRQFPVIARNSSFVYKGRAIDVKQASAELGARYVVTGSVRRAGGRVRIAAQLLEAGTSHTFWAQRWDRTLDDVFALQTEISEAIAVALHPELLGAESKRAIREPPADLNAWDYALRGLWHLNQGGKKNIELALALFERATALDPGSAFAHAHLAQVHYHLLQHYWTDRPAESIERLASAAERAIVCDPSDANGHLFRALACYVRGQLPDAIASLERAVALNPSLPLAHSLLGQFVGISGRTEDGIARLERAIELSPRDPRLWSFHAGIAVVLFTAGRHAEALQAAEISVRIFPDAVHAYSIIASAAALLGDMPRASAALAEVLRLWPNATADKLRMMSASGPPESNERFFKGLRLAGLTD